MKPYYEEPGVTIYHGDCRAILPLLDPVDLVLTDPPYGIDFLSARPIEGREKGKIHGDGFIDYQAMLDWFLPMIKNVLADGGCCCCCGGGGGTPSLAHLWIKACDHLNVENVCVWDKGFVGMGWRYRFQWEAVLVATKGERRIWNGGNNRSNILRFQKVIPQNGDHPTPKPVSLMDRLIQDNSNQDSTICDPFMGSGTTARACKDLGRKFVGVEIDEKWCALAVKRLQQEVFDFK